MSPPNPPSWNSGSFDLASFASRLPFVVPGAIVPEMAARTKVAAIEELVAKLISLNALPKDCDGQIIAAVMRREELGTTAIGRGVAVPHSRHEAIPQVLAAVGFSPDGIEFDALDGGAVHLVVLLLSPANAAGENLRALQQIVVEVRAV